MASPSKFQVGDLVSFNEDSENWQGGKGEVVETGVGWDQFTVKVRLIEGPPKNDMYRDSTSTVLFNPSNLLPWVEEEKPEDDPVSHPSHYTQYPVEVIELTRHMTFADGNVVKYVARSPFKGNRLQDLKKARWYLDDAIAEEEKKLEATK